MCKNSEFDKTYYISKIKILINLFDKHIPLKTVRITKSKSPWIIATLKDMVKERYKVKPKFKRCQTAANWNISNYKRVNYTMTADTSPFLVTLNDTDKINKNFSISKIF